MTGRREDMQMTTTGESQRCRPIGLPLETCNSEVAGLQHGSIRKSVCWEALGTLGLESRKGESD